jgi:hypothetical protein
MIIQEYEIIFVDGGSPNKEFIKSLFCGKGKF